jgi:hypothetical protein
MGTERWKTFGLAVPSNHIHVDVDMVLSTLCVALSRGKLGVSLPLGPINLLATSILKIVDKIVVGPRPF